MMSKARAITASTGPREYAAHIPEATSDRQGERDDHKRRGNQHPGPRSTSD